MTQQQDQHLVSWLIGHESEASRFDTYSKIVAFLTPDRADLLDRMTWTEIRNLAERNA